MRPMRMAMIAAGWFFLVVGIVGIFLPLLPTTPFLLLSAYCFSKTSPRFHHWLIHHPLLGPPIVEWQQSGSIRRRHKFVASTLIFITAGFSAWRFHDKPLVLVVLGLVIFGVLGFIWSRPGR